MPRSTQDIMADAEALALRFEEYERRPDDEADAAAVRELYAAVSARSSAETRLTEAVLAARSGGLSWAYIGSVVGTSGEAARQRYGRLAKLAHAPDADG